MNFLSKKKKKMYKKIKLTDNLTVLTKNGGVCLFVENLREISVHFKTKGGVSTILINLRGGECNFLYIL